MYHPKKLLERELRFTKVYRENCEKDPSVREALCMREQTLHLFVSPHEGDLLAGRIDRPMVGFFPVFEGDAVDKVGYCIDEAGCLNLLAQMERDPACTQAELDEARDMIEFWKKENTNTKTRGRLPEKWKRSLGGDRFTDVSGAVYPIYRIASANLDFERLFELGLCGLIEWAGQRAREVSSAKERAFLESVAAAVETLREVLSLYIEEAGRLMEGAPAERRRELQKMRESLQRVRDEKPRTLQDALQMQNIYMLAGRTTEMGRLDDYLCEFYRRDLENGELTHDEAVRLLDNFFTITEEERGRDTRAIIGGVGRKHEKSADQFDLLVLDVLEGRKYHFYPQVSLRYYQGMDEQIYDRSLQLLGEGYTFPILYNDDVNIPSVMRAMDVPRKVAEQYSFFGCGEYILSHKSIGTPNTALNMAKVLEVTLHNGVDPYDGAKIGLPTGEITDDISFEELMERYQKQIEYFCDLCGCFEELLYDVCREECSFLLMSALYDDCIGRGRAILDGGIFHLGGTVETYGNITTSDSLAAIQEVVYDKKLFPLSKLVKMLDENFEGYEEERRQLIAAEKFGNDYEHADAIAVRVHEHVCNAIRSQRNKTRLDSYLVVVINNSMNVTLGAFVGATPDGRKAGEFLSNGNSPYNSRDKEGITALIQSMTKMDTSIHAGANQNLKFSQGMFRNHRQQVKALLSTFFALGGQQTNLTVVNQKELEDAMLHPENHENLVVRVGGYSARFVQLDERTQRDILLRTAY